MRRYLSVDCGGTKTAFLLCRETGELEAACTLGPGNYMVNGIDHVLSVLKDGILQICCQAAIAQSEITHSFIAIAGFKDIPADVPVLTRLVRETFPRMSITLGNDTENALAGSLLGKQGIHVIAGTGSIGLGFDKDSYYVRSGGWHHLFGGDEGSGYWIGCQLIRHFTMQADGREEKTMMFDYILEKYGLACPEEILRLVINEWKGERDKIASMSKDAYELAEQGDSAAAGIFKSAARELAKIVKGVYRNGNFDIPVYVSYSGGVFKAMKYFPLIIVIDCATSPNGRLFTTRKTSGLTIPLRYNTDIAPIFVPILPSFKTIASILPSPTPAGKSSSYSQADNDTISTAQHNLKMRFFCIHTIIFRYVSRYEVKAMTSHIYNNMS